MKTKTYVIQVFGDPDRPTLYYAHTGNEIDLKKATHFTTRDKAEKIHAICGSYAPRGWTSKVVEA